MARYITLLFLLTFMCFELIAQTTTGKIVGTVTDPSGSMVPKAKVTVTDQGTNHSRTTTTDAQGGYEFPFLPVATYAISVQAPGFQTAGVQSFPLNVDQTARVDIKLVLGQTSENVKVEASAILMQTENASVGTVIDSAKVVDLPLNGRSFVQLALLTPGVNPGTPGSITVRRNRGSLGQSVGMAANGARDTQNRFYYDGIESMDLDSYSFSFRHPSTPSISSGRHQQLLCGDRRRAGRPSQLTTKSGSNAFHGTAWEFNRNDAFEAFNAFQPRTSGAKPPRLNRNQFGANIGGPVWIPKLYDGRDKTFFFFNWESGRQISGTYGGTGAAAHRSTERRRFFRLASCHLRSAERQAIPEQHYSAEPHCELCHQFPFRLDSAAQHHGGGLQLSVARFLRSHQSRSIHLACRSEFFRARHAERELHVRSFAD